MSELSSHSLHIYGLLQRVRQGDRAAQDELFRAISARLEHLARKMLKGFPAVRRWHDVGDVVQNTAIRLLKALQDVRPTTVPDFFNLAAVHLRRALLDLARQVRGRKADLAHCASELADSSSDDGGYRPQAPGEDSGELDRWCKFHQAVEKLPVEEREVVSLIYYHGWKHRDVAELLCKSERTVGRLWRSALKTLKAGLEGC